jgi:hypothetical protein
MFDNEVVHSMVISQQDIALTSINKEWEYGARKKEA